MTAEEQAEVRRVRKVLAWYVRPLFVATVAVTLAGNLSQAEAGWLSWMTHAWAPVIYLLAVELLALRVMAGVWAWWASAFVGVLGLVSFVVSFTYLQEAALEAGWSVWTSYAFPLLVDAFALTLTAAMQGATARVRGIQETAIGREVTEAKLAVVRDESERSRGGRPATARIRKELEQAAAEIRTASEPAVRHTPAGIRITEQHGPDPAGWPATSELSERFGLKPSTISDARKRARQVMAAVSETPRDAVLTT